MHCRTLTRAYAILIPNVLMIHYITTHYYVPITVSRKQIFLLIHNYCFSICYTGSNRPTANRCGQAIKDSTITLSEAIKGNTSTIICFTKDLSHIFFIQSYVVNQVRLRFVFDLFVIHAINVPPLSFITIVKRT